MMLFTRVLAPSRLETTGKVLALAWSCSTLVGTPEVGKTLGAFAAMWRGE